jgi:hypothetical protein
MAEKLQTMRIIWGALLMSTFMYLVVVFVVQQNGTRPTEEISPLLAPAFALAAVGLAVASVVLPRAMLKTALLAKRWRIGELPAEQRLFSDRQGRSRYFSDPQSVRGEAFPAQQTSFMVGMALAEAVALFGFMLLYLGFGWAWGTPFFVVCWGLMLTRFPSSKRLDQQIEQAYDADLQPPEGAAGKAPR